MKFSFLILSLLFLISCGESNQQVQEIDYTEENEATILAYLEKKQLKCAEKCVWPSLYNIRTR